MERHRRVCEGGGEEPSSRAGLCRRRIIECSHDAFEPLQTSVISFARSEIRMGTFVSQQEAVSSRPDFFSVKHSIVLVSQGVPVGLQAMSSAGQLSQAVGSGSSGLFITGVAAV